MLLSSSGFVTICPKKEVELGADKHLHRADHAEELKQEIHFAAPSATGNQYAFLPGGAVRALNPSSSMTLAETSSCIAVFKGNLLNKAELALQVTGCPPRVAEAQLLLHLYETIGIDMLSRLNGQYAFCLYDSKQARVLAARDHSGVVPLLEGRTALGSLIIACGTFLPEGTTQMTEIKAGEMKYGWHALPRPFKCGHRVIAGRASCEYGIRRRSIDAYNAPPARQSVDLPRQSSMDIPRQRHTHHLPSSHSYSHTPGKYMPPHLAGTAGGQGANPGNGVFARQRAASLDGHNLQQHDTSSTHQTTPLAANISRRQSETNTQSLGSSSHNQPQQWVPKGPAAVTAPPAGVKPAPIDIPSAGAASVSVKGSEDAPTPSSEAVSTPVSAASAEHHRRRRRHHKRRSHSNAAAAVADAAAAAAAANDDAHSEADSQVSSSTHDSAKFGPPAVGGAAPIPPAINSSKRSPTLSHQLRREVTSAPAAAAARKPGRKHPHQQSHMSAAISTEQGERRVSGGSAGRGGFKRTGSCGELAALGGSPVTHSVLVAAPQGLAC